MVEVLAEMCGSCVGCRAQRGWRVLQSGVLLTNTHRPQHQPLTAHFPPPGRGSRAQAARLKQHIRRLILLREAAAQRSSFTRSSAKPRVCFLTPGRLQHLEVLAALCQAGLGGGEHKHSHLPSPHCTKELAAGPRPSWS